MEQSFLPSLTNNNGANSKHDAKKKNLRQKKQNDDRMFVSFPEAAKTIKATKKAFAKKSSSSKISSQTEDLSKSKKSGRRSSIMNKGRSGKVRLPSLVLTPTSERVVTEERWSKVLGLRDSYEIPRTVFNKLTDEILKIDQQLEEEAKMRQIRERRILYSDKKLELSSSASHFVRTSRPGFSYFPCLTRSVGDLPGSKELFWMEDKGRERMFREEQMIQRKMREFKNRHSYNASL